MIYLGVFIFGLIGLYYSKTGGSTLTGYDNLYKKYASIYGLDWKMLKAIAVVESNEGQAPSVARGLSHPNDIEASESTDGLSWGLMQVTIGTARDYDDFATAIKLNNPDYSVKIAAMYVDDLRKIFPGDNEFIVKSYNQGQGNSIKEKKKQISGYASGYWMKYKNAYSSIEGI